MRGRRNPLAVLGMVPVMALYANFAWALDAPAVDSAVAMQAASASSGSGAAGGANDNEAETPDSVEQGHTQMPDSFDHRPIAALLHESTLVGLRDTTLSLQLRTYDLDRINFDGSTSEAWTLGGSAGFKTGYFENFIALGATGYTSQRLYGPLDKDGTKLLQSGQEPYTVMGELYGQFRLTDEIVAIAGRKALDTPYINTQDSLMTPNTFNLYAVQGTIGSTDERTLRFGVGFVDQIKERNSENFQSMATAAGAPAGVDRGVYTAGVNYKAGTFAIGAIDYYSADIINILYTEIKYTVPLAKRVSLRFGVQYSDQSSIGADLLTGKAFSTHQEGAKAELGFGPALFTVARTLTAVGTVTGSGTGSGTDMRNPWGAYPGYTSVQIEDFYRAGENATMLRAAYNFPRFTGLSVYALWVDGSTPNVQKQYAQKETDLNVKWTPQHPAWKHLTLLVRYGHVSQGGPKDQHEDELRLVLYYQLR